MEDKDLALRVGINIKEYRKLRKMTQKELGEKIGVAHNTISSYESGTNAPEQNAIFAIATALDVKVSDLFPPVTNDADETLQKAVMMINGRLDADHSEFLKKLIEKTLSLSEREREKFIGNIRFAIEYFERK